MHMTKAFTHNRLWQQLTHNRSGVAMIEFALAAPLLLTAGLVGVEVANLTLTVLRVNQLAMMAADNAARVRASIDETDVNEVMIGMRFAGSTIQFGERGRVIISTLEPNGLTGNNAGYMLSWQRCFGAKNVTSRYGPELTGKTSSAIRFGVTPTGIAASATDPKAMVPPSDTALMLAEVRYTYQPIVASMFFEDQELSSIQAFPVRERAAQTLTNRSGLSTAAKRLCDTAHLSPN